jgi:hypothetical protein
MKSRRLTETDLANMAFQSAAHKRERIISLLKPKVIIGSYEPFRHNAGDALNEQFPFLDEEQDPTPLGKLEEVVMRACRGDATLLKMNLAVVRATHKFAIANNVTAERTEIRPITLAFGHAYNFGMPLILRYNGEAKVVFPDLRRTGGLTSGGRRTVFSAMHQRFRVNYPDYTDLRLEIWQYENNAERQIRSIQGNDLDLVPYDALVADIAESYAILHAVLREHEDERRRRGGSPGPLFGTG